MAQIQLVPTLATMADIYRLPREGGAASLRFKRYVELVPGHYGLVAYNPMAGPHALETTEQLLAVNAEAVAIEAAREAVNLCSYPDTITLAVVLCAPGGWTDRLATEIEHRTAHRLPSGRGLVLHWTRETPTAEQIRREAIAEAVRVMARAVQGRRESVRSLLHREGLAYALGGNPYGPVTAEDQHAVGDAVEVLGASEAIGDMTAILYGDAAAAALGWTPAGIAEHGGYRWAIDEAGRRIEDLGAPAALRAITAS
jgi:Arc/MetJ family transcription regulator